MWYFLYRISSFYNMFISECFDKTDKVSLYVHIPFCYSKCAYCAFYSVPKCRVNRDLKKRYFEKLKNELKACIEYFEKPFETIYIGGGTPLMDDQTEDIAEILYISQSQKAKEVTLECNIENYTPSVHAALYKNITRVSAGVQSFCSENLKALGRRKSTIKDVVSFIKTASPLSVNLDFITGIPSYLFDNPINSTNTSDDIAALFDNLKQSGVRLPDHLSVYLLSIEEGTALKKKNDNIINKLKISKDMINTEDDRASDNLKKIWELLKKNNFNHYEVSAFAQKGKECKHNGVYWSLNNYIGLGSTSSSHSVKGYDITSPCDYSSYALSPLFSTYKTEKCNNYDIAVEMLLTTLRTTRGISKNRFDSVTGLSLDRIVYNASKKCTLMHNVCNYYKNGVLSLTEDELIFSDYYIGLLSEIVLNYNQL